MPVIYLKLHAIFNQMVAEFSFFYSNGISISYLDSSARLKSDSEQTPLTIFALALIGSQVFQLEQICD